MSGQSVGLAYSKVVSPNDHMWNTGSDWYFDVGLSALECIRRAFSITGAVPRAILDLPCGHGRVCRMLRAAFPTAHLTVCDLDADGVDFCAATFDAEALYSVPDPRNLQIGRQFDLVWCGSLFTHLDRDQWSMFLEFFERSLAPDGMLVFTTHGRQPIQWMLDGFFDYGLRPEEQRALIDRYTSTGFGFVSPANQAFGLSLSSTAHVCAQIERHPGLKIVGVHEAGWAGHQDVFTCMRLRASYPALHAR